MARFLFFFFFFFFFCVLTQLTKPNMAYPLSTNSRWIVDEKGQRVKLACVNWPSHLEPVVAEGLSKQPMDSIAKKIVAMGFNCVRLTWPLDLATNDTLANKITVRQSFESLGLSADVSGIQTYNPSIIDLPIIKAFQALVSCLGNNGVMVILDNHLTTPGWCCGYNDGSGFFGDKFFNPAAWVSGLKKMATMFKGFTNVVGMSLRNELRGPRQNVNDWFKYMQQGAEAVHSSNPNVLVILSGLSFDNDLSFVKTRSVSLTFTKKLVFELHWYGFSDGDAWVTNNPNQMCGRVMGNVDNKARYLLDEGFPLFVSEFGIDERGGNENDNRYFNCFLGWAAENDVDWAAWVLIGSYYLREGVVGLIEYYGVLDTDCAGVRNSSYLQKLSIIQTPYQGPGAQADMHNLILHPLTGLCVLRKSTADPTLTLGPCQQSEPWTYTSQNVLQIQGTPLCIQTDGTGNSVRLGTVCTGPGSTWERVSDSKMHLSSEPSSGTSVCLDVDSGNNIVANGCNCLSGDNSCDPASQWFKIIGTTKKSAITKSPARNLPGKGIL